MNSSSAMFSSRLRQYAFPRLVPCLLLVLLCRPVCLQAQDNDKETGQEEKSIFGLSWLDQTQAYASRSANSMAQQFDRFFGTPRSDLEAAYSSLRLTQVNGWYEKAGYKSDIRLRGNIHLPRLNERISLIFSEDGVAGSPSNQNAGTATDQQQNTKVNLQYNFFTKARNRLDFRLGIRKPLRLKLGLRYRWEDPVGEDMLQRFIQNLYFTDGRGFGTRSRYQLEKPFGDDSLLRWSNEIRAEEDEHGATWLSSLTFAQRRSDKTAISYYGSVIGVTGPTSYTESYNTGLRLRRNVERPWLFMELEPGYRWIKTEAQAPRDGEAFIFLRLEMAIGHLD